MSKTEVILSIANVIVAAATLSLSYMIYRKYLYQQVQSRQMNIVIDLVEYIQNTPIKVYCSQRDENDKSTSNINNNALLFEMRAFSYIPKETLIWFAPDMPHPIDFTKFSSNPLLPKTIADILVNFNSYNIRLITEEQLEDKDNKVILYNLKSVEDHGYNLDSHQKETSNKMYWSYTNAPAYKNWDSFVKHSILLKKAIIAWLHDQGVDNINVRDSDFKYTAL